MAVNPYKVLFGITFFYALVSCYLFMCVYNDYATLYAETHVIECSSGLDVCTPNGVLPVLLIVGLVIIVAISLTIDDKPKKRGGKK